MVISIPKPSRRAATEKFLEKFWGTGDRLKFIGIACGRGDTEDAAKKSATSRAHELVRRAVEGLEINVLAGDFQPLGYRKDEERYRCVSVARGQDAAKRETSAFFPDPESEDDNSAAPFAEERERGAGGTSATAAPRCRA